MIDPGRLQIVQALAAEGHRVLGLPLDDDERTEVLRLAAEQWDGADAA